MERMCIATTKNGCDVYVDLEKSHAATHIRDNPQLIGLMKDVLSRLVIFENVIRFDIDLETETGTSEVIETMEGDDIFYAKRPNRRKYARFVRDRLPVPTTYITIELRRRADKEYDVFTAYIGKVIPHFLLDKNDTNEAAREFWKNHALVYTNQEIVVGTETAECPW